MRYQLTFSKWDGLGYYHVTDGPEWERQILLHYEEQRSPQGGYHRIIDYTFNPPSTWQPSCIN